MHHRILALFLVFGLLAAATGCQQPADDPSPTTTESRQAETTALTPSPAASTEPADTEDPDPSDEVSDKVSGTIHVNQLGYRPDDRKMVLFDGYTGPFQILEAESRQVVFSGETTTDPVSDQASGSQVYTGDFSRLAEPGRYYVLVPGYGRSYTFEVDRDVYRDLRQALLKMLYYQRCGMELEETYAGIWAHAACHTKDAWFYHDQDRFQDTSGGWHDAGDYGKYTVPAAKTIADLLLAYELFPGAFNLPVQIPESGSGLPDILDEARYGLDFMLKMQDPDSGGAYHKVSTRNFPDNIPPDWDLANRYITSVSATATGCLAAVSAMAARVYQDIDPEFAAAAAETAFLAWGWLQANPDAPPYTNPHGMTTGEYGDSNDRDERFWAAAELYRLTGETEYSDYILAHIGRSAFDPYAFGWQDVGGYGTVALLLACSRGLDPEVQSALLDGFFTEADRLLAMSRLDGYYVAMGIDEYYWGSNMLLMNRGMHLIIAHLLSGETAYLQTAQDHLHYLLGRNVLSQSYVTGYGSRPVRFPHHRPSRFLAPHDPLPGLVAGGPNSGLQDAIARSMIPADTPPARCYVDQAGSYSTNEVTIYWNSPALFVAAFFDYDPAAATEITDCPLR